jgi:dUTP pyrophosphatase
VDISEYTLVKFKKVHPDAVAPVFSHSGDSGFDLCSTKNIVMYSGMVETIPTGLKFEIPQGYEIQVRPKSGLSAKSPLRVILGTVDSCYRGEVSIIVENPLQVNNTPWRIDVGDKIAQGVIVKLPEVMFEEVEELSETSRGENGFGSTGMKACEHVMDFMPTINDPLGQGHCLKCGTLSDLEAIIRYRRLKKY